MASELGERVRDEILERGAMPFDQFVEVALYDAELGFYAQHGQAGGRRGDFVTSVEAGPLFAALVADWLDSTWTDLGEPGEFLVSEAGAGVGTLFRGINRAEPRCLDALTYTLVERSAVLRATHESLPTNRWRSSESLPTNAQHVVIANELLDNLAFGIAERVADGWAPLHVATDADDLALRVADADVELAHLDGLTRKAQIGARVPIAREAADWIELARELAERVLIFDYAATSAELADRGQDGWLRTYVGHTRGSDPLLDIGHRDITHDVPVDQLPTPTIHLSQAEWLRQNGLDERVQAARQTWEEKGHIGDLEAMVARSAIGEAEALTDPDGLGAFQALEWHRYLA